MVNETRYQYLWTMDQADEQRLFDELSAIGIERDEHDAKGIELTDRAQRAAKKALEQGMKPSRIARALHYTDGYIRKLRLEADLPPDPRYAGNTPPPRRQADVTAEPAAPTTTPFMAPTEASTPPTPRSISATGREAVLMAMADDLNPDREDDLVILMNQRNSAWLHLVHRPGMTNRELIRQGVKDGKLTATDLRN